MADISLTPYLHFHKTYNHQIRQASTSRGVDSNEVNQAGGGDVIMSRSCKKLKAVVSPLPG